MASRPVAPTAEAELAAILAAIQEQTGGTAFAVEALCFGPQLAFVNSAAKRQVAECSRRAGKTTGIAVKLLRAARSEPFTSVFYVAPTLKQARRSVWPVLKRLNAEHGLGGRPNEVDGYIAFPELATAPRIYIAGAKDAGEIDSLRGILPPPKLAIIDEGQSIRPSMWAQLVDDVLEPALTDYDGVLAVAGTPGAVKAGYFYGLCRGDVAGAWEHHRWTMRENPWLQKMSGRPIDEMLREVRERHGWTEDNPTYRREYLGEWVSDTGALMLHYDRARNGCEWAGPQDGWTYVLAFDIGYEDADAITVLGWPRHDRRVRKVAEKVTRKQGITELGDQLRALYHQYAPVRLVGDMGALGKKIGAELHSRWGLPVEPADKTRKAEHVALLDDALLTGHFLAPPDSRFAEDCALLQWDADARAKGELKESPAYHSDVADSVLYGFRACHAYLEQNPPAKPADEGRRMLEERVAQFKKAQEQPWWLSSAERLGFDAD